MRFGIRELIFLMVLLAVPVASFLYVFKPRNDEIRQATEEIEIKKAKLNKLSEETQRIEDIGIMIERGKERIALIEAKLPSEQDVEGVLGQISQLSDRNKQIIKSIKSEKPIPAAMPWMTRLRSPGSRPAIDGTRTKRAAPSATIMCVRMPAAFPARARCRPMAPPSTPAPASRAKARRKVPRSGNSRMFVSMPIASRAGRRLGPRLACRRLLGLVLPHRFGFVGR